MKNEIHIETVKDAISDFPEKERTKKIK